MFHQDTYPVKAKCFARKLTSGCGIPPHVSPRHFSVDAARFLEQHRFINPVREMPMNPTIRAVSHENRRRHASALRPIALPQQGEAEKPFMVPAGSERCGVPDVLTVSLAEMAEARL